MVTLSSIFMQNGKEESSLELAGSETCQQPTIVIQSFGHIIRIATVQYLLSYLGTAVFWVRNQR
ncbi:MAG: hypothetical protein AB8W78_04060 [Arsenophonus endosymbiont of Dermacentor nuttalli]